MRRTIFTATLIVAAFAWTPGAADDLTPPDGSPYGEDCLSERATGVGDPANPNDDNLPRKEDVEGAGPGRLSICVSDGNRSNRNELYIGGDFSRLQNGDPNRQCMHIEVAGQVVWRRPNYRPAQPPNDPSDSFCH